MTQKLYNEETLKELIPQGSEPKFIGHFSKDMYDEWKSNPNVLDLTCGCTSISVDKELEQITFVVKAPEFTTDLPQPYLKIVKPSFKSKISGVKVTWEIKFNVKPNKD